MNDELFAELLGSVREGGAILRGEFKGETMPESTEETLNIPLLPPLTWREFYWAGDDSLPTWAGYQARFSSDIDMNSRSEFQGQFELSFNVAEDKGSPTPEQIAAYIYLLENQEATRDAILQSVFESYPQWQGDFGFDENELKEFMPDIEDINGLKDLVEIVGVTIHQEHKEGISYVGFSLGCTWDEEHALGAMTHKNRVVEVGGGDVAILEWIAVNDGGTRP